MLYLIVELVSRDAADPTGTVVGWWQPPGPHIGLEALLPLRAGHLSTVSVGLYIQVALRSVPCGEPDSSFRQVVWPGGGGPLGSSVAIPVSVHNVTVASVHRLPEVEGDCHPSLGTSAVAVLREVPCLMAPRLAQDC